MHQQITIAKALPKVFIELCNPNAQIPQYETTWSAGLDIRACTKGVKRVKSFDYNDLERDNEGSLLPKNIRIPVDGKFVIMPNECVLVPTGLKIRPQSDWCELLVPRSGHGTKKGLILANTVGVIDPDYGNEMLVALYNRTKRQYVVQHGERICQMLFMPVSRAELIAVEALPPIDTNRIGGFGSSGND